MVNLYSLTSKTLFILTATICCLAWPGEAAADANRDLRVTPDRVLLLPGESVRFEAHLTDDEGVPSNPIEWEVIPARLGTIGPDGLFVAGDRPGRGIVRAVAHTGEKPSVGHALVRIGSGGEVPLRVIIEPRETRVAPGEAVHFAVSVLDPQTGVAVTGVTEWRLIPPDIGSIDPSGTFTAGILPGHGRIAAAVTDGDRHGVGYAAIHVGRAANEDEVSIRIHPEEAELAVGEEIDFQARIEPPDLEEQVEWLVVPRHAGTVSEGRFRAGSRPVDGRVIASIITSTGVARADARVRIRDHGEETGVMVKPEKAVVRAGNEARFTLYARGSGSGAPLAPVEWSVRPLYAGWIGPDGVFHASGAGSPTTAHVIGIYRDLESGRSSMAAAQVNIVPVPADRVLHIRPRIATVLPGEHIQFRIDQEDAALRSIEWDVAPSRLGTITPDGFFTASRAIADVTSGEFLHQEGIVTAKTVLGNALLKGSARIIIGTESSPTELVIRPPGWIGEVTLSDLNRKLSFQAMTVGPGIDSPVAVEWKLDPPGPLSLFPIRGDRTTVSWNHSSLSPSALSLSLYNGRLLAELLLPNGQRIGAAVPLVIRLKPSTVDLTVTPSPIRISVGESVTLTLEAAVGNIPVALSHLHITGHVIPQQRGNFNSVSLTFTAKEEGIAALIIQVTGNAAPADGRITVPIHVESNEAGTGRKR